MWNLNFPQSRILCAKTAAALQAMEQDGRSPDPRLMAAVEAKLAYLDGQLTAKELERFRLEAETARKYALRLLVVGPQAGVSKEAVMDIAEFYAAEAAVCAASITSADAPLLVALSTILRKFGLLKRPPPGARP